MKTGKAGPAQVHTQKVQGALAVVPCQDRPVLPVRARLTLNFMKVPVLLTVGRFLA